LEPQRLTWIEMDIRDVGSSDDLQLLFRHLLAEVFRHDGLEHILADLAGKPGADQVGWRFAWTETRQPRFFLNTGDNLLGCAIKLLSRNSDFDLVLATFDEHE